MHWNDILQEVRDKKSGKCRSSLIGLCGDRPMMKQSNQHSSVRGRATERYYLGDKFEGAYFTRREAECMVQFLKGKTISQAALSLNLSPRTVEFYLKNMKNKLSCQTRPELIQAIVNSDFQENVDFVGT